jgi:tetratricopeptide (TPR) repeat protein
MDSVFIEYRDPLFSIISIFIIVFIISVISFLSSLRKQNNNKKTFDDMLSRLSFSYNKTKAKKQKINYANYYKKGLISYQAMAEICASLIYQKKHNEAISLYLIILKNTNKKNRKLELMFNLAQAYFDCGFLQRSYDMYLELIRLDSKNIKALKQLFMISLKLNNFSLSRDILQSLKELKINTYAMSVLHKISKNIRSNKSLDKKTKKLITICSNDVIATRMVAEFLLQNNKQAFWSNLKVFNLEQCIDILWLQEINEDNKKYITNNKFLTYLFYHKQDNTIQAPINTTNSEVGKKHINYLEIDILNNLKDNNSNIDIDISFSFFCNNCKKIHYSSDFVCSHCKTIFESSINMAIIKKMFKS